MSKAADKDLRKKYGDEEPTLKDFLIVVLVAALIIALSWIAYYKLHLF